MSIQAVAWALEQDLPARPKLVLVSIANHADHTSGYCFLRADTIAAESACTVRSVYRFIGGLMRNGYIRRETKRGEDGKQRANDYWILFHRPSATWDWAAEVDGDHDHEDASDDTTSSEPSDTVSPGESSEPGDTGVTRHPVDKHTVSPGPSDNGVTRKSLEEPSESKPEEKKGSSPLAAALRKYQPPPPVSEAAQGALHPDASKPIFVYQGTRAWDAWMKHKLRTTGHHFGLSKTMLLEGQKRTGWWFPTLFPPSEETGKESAEGSNTIGPPFKKTA